MRKLRIVAVSVALLGLLLAVPGGARAATPSEGTINQPADNTPGERGKVTYDGNPITGALVFSATAAKPVCADAPAPPPGQCDEFGLHLKLPADYYTARENIVSSRLEVTIDWSSAPSAESQDVDLLIVNKETGEQVGGGETDNIASGDPKETATVANPVGGDYRIIAAGIIGSVPTYKGTVRFILTPAEAVNTVVSNNVQFGPATVVNPTIFGGEPGINGDPSGGNRWWIDWPVGTRSQTSTLSRSTDGGDTFRLMTNPSCPLRRAPGCLTGGGGDSETAVDKDGTIYWSNQEGLANEAVNVSTDHGVTWPADRENAITSIQATADRQWLATNGGNTGYIAASAQIGGTALARTDDGGKTWTRITPIDNGLPGSSAPVLVDNTGGPRNGVVYALSRGSGLSISVSRDKGATFHSFPSTDAPLSGPAAEFKPSPLLIPWMTMDRAGNLYVVWSDGSNNAVYMTTMKADDPRNAGDKLGSTWSKPVKVSVAPAKSTVFTQAIAGDPGRVAIGYQGADFDKTSSDAPDGTPWNIYVSVATDALCQWNNTCKGSGPAFTQNQANERVNHYDDICVSGLGCTANPDANRNLADFFDLGVDNDGRIGLTWSDDNNSLNGVYITFAKVKNGPSLLAGRPDFREAVAANSVKALSGDAIWPLNEPGGKNYPTLDLTGASTKFNGDNLEVSLNLASGGDPAAGLAAGYDGQHVKYVARWWFGNESWFAAMDTTGGNSTPSFYAGKVDAGDELLRNGVTSVYGTRYVPDFDIKGTVSNGTITFSIPLAQIGKPTPNDRLLSVQGFSMTGPADEQQSIYNSSDTIDATPPFDYSPAAAVAAARAGGQGAPAGGSLPATGGQGLPLAVGGALVALGLTWRLRRRASAP